MDLQVADDPGQERFEIRADGELAHLVRSALDSVRQRNLAVLPYCPFVRRWMTEHHEYADLVPDDRRAQFGL